MKVLSGSQTGEKLKVLPKNMKTKNEEDSQPWRSRPIRTAGCPPFLVQEAAATEEADRTQVPQVGRHVVSPSPLFLPLSLSLSHVLGLGRRVREWVCPPHRHPSRPSLPRYRFLAAFYDKFFWLKAKRGSDGTITRVECWV